MKIRRSILAMLETMVLTTVGLSLLFNFLCIKRLVPDRDFAYFCVLLFEALVCMVILGVLMRRMRYRLIMQAEHEKMRIKKANGGDEAYSGDAVPEYSIELEDYRTKVYFLSNFGALAIFALIVYGVRIVLGALLFRWLFAITNFSNFSHLFHNVYASIAVFFTMLACTVFIAQINVTKNREIILNGIEEERDQRIEDAQKETERLRVENAGDVDVLGAVLKQKHRRHRHHSHH